MEVRSIKDLGFNLLPSRFEVASFVQYRLVPVVHFVNWTINQATYSGRRTFVFKGTLKGIRSLSSEQCKLTQHINSSFSVEQFLYSIADWFITAHIHLLNNQCVSKIFLSFSLRLSFLPFKWKLVERFPAYALLTSMYWKPYYWIF